jgi:uncharacterized protein involved in propanediol utilization
MSETCLLEKCYVGKCFSSYGELLQGCLSHDEHFLVTIPIKTYAYAQFVFDDSCEGIQVFPSSKTKSALFLSKLNEAFHLNLSGRVTLNSEIPMGKGLSSSTADLIACQRAIEAFLDRSFPNENINTILREIEPSDGLLYPCSVVYNHRLCRFIKGLGLIPPSVIISIDCGGTLDTVTYNAQERLFSGEDKAIYAQLLDEITIAFQQQDLRKIGEIATKSAILNQKFNFKPELDRMIALANEFGAYGVINTHSGTCLGLLFDPKNPLIDDAIAHLKSYREIAIYHTL